MEAYVKRTLCAGTYSHLIYVLYSDNTFEEYRPDVKSLNALNKNGISFKDHLNIKTIAKGKFTKQQVKEYFETKTKEWKEKENP